MIKKVIKILLILVLTLLTASCTTTEIFHPSGAKFINRRFLMETHVLVILPDGTVLRYSSDPDNKTIESISSGVTKGLLKAVKP